MNLTLTIPESTQPPITVTVGGTTELTSYETQVESLPDYPATFPPAIGSAANQAVAGNDPRLTNERTPSPHTHPLAELTGVTPAAIGAVETTALSTNGGANKVPQFDADGNLRLGFYRTDSAATTAPSELTGYNGNLLVADDKFLGWMASDLNGTGNYGVPHLGKLYASIRYDRSHSGVNGEWNFDAQGRVCWYWNGGMQLGNANGGNHHIYLHSGWATVSNQQRQSVPFKFNTSTWTNGAANWQQMGVQARPLDLTGSNSELAFYTGMEADPIQQDQDQTTAEKIASLTKDGFWSKGTAPSFSALADAATITQSCSKWKSVQNASVTLAGDRVLSITGAQPGMRGVIYCSQDAAGSRTLALPAGSATPSGWGLSTSPYAVDRLSWDYDGTFFFWAMVKGINLPLDSDVSSFLSRASIVDQSISQAVNSLVLSLKGQGLWGKFDSLWPLVGGTAAAHSQDLKNANVVQWAGGLTHNGDGVTADGVSGRGDTGWLPNSRSASNAQFHIYNRSSAPTGSFFGASSSGPTSRFGLRQSGPTTATVDGPQSSYNSSIAWAIANWKGHFAIHQTADNRARLRSSVATTATSGVLGNADRTANSIALFARKTGASTYDMFGASNIAFAAAGAVLDDTELAAYIALVNQFQTALGRANP